MFSVRMSEVGDQKQSILLDHHYNSVGDALIAARARCRQIFDEERFTFTEITRNVFMIKRNGKNSGLITLTDEQ